MKYFWVSALIALSQIILLSLMVKCMNRKKAIPAILFFLLKCVSYYYIVHALVDKYLAHIIECVCGYVVGLTSGSILLYVFCFFIYPLVILKLLSFMWRKFIAIPKVQKVWVAVSDKIEDIMHRLGLGNKRGFKVKKVKF